MEELVRQWRTSVLRGEKTDELGRQAEAERPVHNPLAEEEAIREDCSHGD